MCAYSMIADHYKDKWQDQGLYRPGLGGVGALVVQPASKADVDALRKEVEELKALLKRAIKYDEENGEPECEMAEKVAILKKVADMVGVDLSEVISKPLT